MTCVCVCSRAFVYLSQNNYAEAHASFIEVLKIDPKNPVVSTTQPLRCHIALARIWGYDKYSQYRGYKSKYIRNLFLNLISGIEAD